MICSRPNCKKKAWRGGECHAHVEHAIAMGLRGRTTAGPTIRHIQKLLDLGWSYRGIARAAGVAHSQVRDVMVGRRGFVLARTRDKVLSVPLEPYETHVVSSVGSVRRVEGLMWLGHPLVDVCERANFKTRGFQKARRSGHITRSVAEQIDRVFRELVHVPGPSRLARARARRVGFVSPFAWDNIDDPDEVPIEVDHDESLVDELAVELFLRGQKVTLTPAEKAVTARMLVERGFTRNTAAVKLNVNVRSVQRWLQGAA